MEIVYLSLLKLVPNSEKIKTLRRRNQKKAIRSFLDSLPLGTKTGKRIELDRVENITKRDFFNKYVNKRVPVILKGAMKDWGCVEKWSLDFFSNAYGEDEYHIVTPEGFLCKDELAKYCLDGISAGKFSFKNIIKKISSQETVYLRLFPLLENHPELLNDIDTNWLKKMSRSVMGAIYHTFIGHKGRKSHSHSGSTGFFSLMIQGQKEWKFWDTSYYPILNLAEDYSSHFSTDISREDENIFEKYPHYRFIDRYEGVVEEGDIVYCPVWMFHAAENKSLTIAVRYGVFDPIDYIKSSIGLLFLKIFMTDFLTIFRFSRKGNSHDRESHQTTPKIVKR